MNNVYIMSCRDGKLQHHTMLIGRECYEYSGEDTEELATTVAQRIFTYKGSFGIGFVNGLRLVDGKPVISETLDTSLLDLFEQRLTVNLAKLCEGRAQVFPTSRMN